MVKNRGGENGIILQGGENGISRLREDSLWEEPRCIFDKEGIFIER